MEHPISSPVTYSLSGAANVCCLLQKFTCNSLSLEVTFANHYPHCFVQERVCKGGADDITFPSRSKLRSNRKRDVLYLMVGRVEMCSTHYAKKKDVELIWPCRCSCNSPLSLPCFLRIDENKFLCLLFVFVCRSRARVVLCCCDSHTNSTLLHCLPTDAGGEEDFGRWRFRRDDLDHWEPFFFSRLFG